MGLDGNHVPFHRNSNTAVFLIRQNGRALQRLTQYVAVRLDRCNGSRRNYSGILRKTSVNKLRSEANVADLGANMITTDRYLCDSLFRQHPLQLEHALTWHDHLLRSPSLRRQGCFTQG